MESAHNLGGNYWGALINPDKGPAPLLEQLCLGIAQIMPSLEPSSGNSDLTPEKLAAFYREVGGNWDMLFLQTSGPALSFIYQSLGCFHSLQPTRNPFEAPSVPALLPHGFVRWQTIQILLSPDEHSRYLQNAVSQWDIPNPNGGFFPKTIPREAFPPNPDPDMVAWHESVGRRLEDDYQKSKSSRQTSPESSTRSFHSGPKDARTAEEDYFSHSHGRLTPCRPRSKTESYGNSSSHAPMPRRRSEEPLSPGSTLFESEIDSPVVDKPSARAPTSRLPTPPPRVARSMLAKAKEQAAMPARPRGSRIQSESSASEASSEESIMEIRRGSADDRRYGRRHDLSPPRSSHTRSRSHDAAVPHKHRRDPSPHHSGRTKDRVTYYPNPQKEPDTYKSSRHGVKSYSDGQVLPRRTKGPEPNFREYVFEEPRKGYRITTIEPPARSRLVPRYVDMNDYYGPRYPVEPSPPEDKRRGSYSGSSSKDRSSSSSGNERSKSYSKNNSSSRKWAGASRNIPEKRFIPVSVAEEYEPVATTIRRPVYDPYD
ncbi:conserved hypothetical protein [Paecilomyces variotii No. 5]|uniref:DUF7514 domain-containing protein n=1 Tax=Byssochlamys spectabilis (strain No. 5 / NBRC 109023) TaxID=1356009 RepID=V5FW08_BYSSN|nr:conserved hypothetical protein [Paecilomyces variotii No. 5]